MADHRRSRRPRHRAIFIAANVIAAVTSLAYFVQGQRGVGPKQLNVCLEPTVATATVRSMIAAAAPRPVAVTSTGVAWLATGAGVARLRPAAGGRNPDLRRYAAVNGLPEGNVAAIAADDTGAWCVVLPDAEDPRRPDPSCGSDLGHAPLSHLCRYDARADRWQVLRSLAPAAPALSTSWSRSVRGYKTGFNDAEARFRSRVAVVAATGDFVCFSASREVVAGQPLLHVWDRRTGAWHDAAWNGWLPYAAALLHDSGRDDPFAPSRPHDIRGAERVSPSPLLLTFSLRTNRRGDFLLSTNLGVFRYRPTSRTWRFVTGGLQH